METGFLGWEDLLSTGTILEILQLGCLHCDMVCPGFLQYVHILEEVL